MNLKTLLIAVYYVVLKFQISNFNQIVIIISQIEPLNVSFLENLIWSSFKLIEGQKWQKTVTKGQNLIFINEVLDLKFSKRVVSRSRNFIKGQELQQKY